MAEFNPINTQEEFDTAIGARLQRERETVAKKYVDYEDLKKQVSTQQETIDTLTRERDENAEKYAGSEKTIAELQARVKGYETSSAKMRIALEHGIPMEMADRLSGETEEDIRKDAAAMSKFVSKSKYVPPMKTEDENDGKTERAALRGMLRNLKGE